MRNLLVDISHVTLTYLVTYCSAFGTRFESIMAAMWDQRIFVTDRLNTHTHTYTHTLTHTHTHIHTHIPLPVARQLHYRIFFPNLQIRLQFHASLSHDMISELS